MTSEEEFEFLKKSYILKSAAHLKALEEVTLDDLKETGTLADIAIIQADVATSYMELCKFMIMFKKL